MSAKRGKPSSKEQASKKPKASPTSAAITASALWKSADVSDWEAALSRYNGRIQSRYDGFSKGRKKVPLPSHDAWLWQTLPGEVKAQKGCLNHSQLVKIMEWKLSRGQSRPLLKRLKENNTESSVKAISKRAFTHADQGQTADAFKTLCELSYVGPATASAILAPLYPELVAFMSDELMAIVPGVVKDQYTMASLTTLLTAVSARQGTSPVETWTLADIERAVWSASG